MKYNHRIRSREYRPDSLLAQLSYRRGLGGKIICTVMKTWKEELYQHLWQGLLSCELYQLQLLICSFYEQLTVYTLLIKLPLSGKPFVLKVPT